CRTTCLALSRVFPCCELAKRSSRGKPHVFHCAAVSRCRTKSIAHRVKTQQLQNAGRARALAKITHGSLHRGELKIHCGLLPVMRAKNLSPRRLPIWNAK